MIEKIIKAVKRGNKKRSRNITIGAVVGFLLSCTAVMGADSYLWIKGDSGEIKFNTEKTTKVDGSDEGNWSTTNPYSDNNWNTETKTYTNNIELSSNGANGVSNNGYNDYDISYGLRLSGNLTDVNFINNSSIKGEMSGSTYNYGYGIHNSAKMGNIENTGKISGTGDTFGYGIFNSATMRKIENKNKGTISGVGGNTSGNGYGIANNSGTIEEITNAGEISGTGSGKDKNSGVGYGIYNNSLNSNIEGKITNAGVISGTGKSAGSGYGTGYGIDNKGTIKDITNTGEISGAGSSSSGNGTGYGIYNMSEDKKIGKIINTGIISGTGSSSSGKGIGSGIYNYGSMDKAIIEDITNAGIISGTGSSTSGTGTGSGIYNHSAKIENITNMGVMSGSGNSAGYGIYNIKDVYESTIGNIKNTGLISGTGNSTSGKGTGYGIYNFKSEMENITNTGVISGIGNSTSDAGTGSGINNDSDGKEMGAITNTGIISGYGNSTGGNGAGYGIYNKSGTMGAITNTGVISSTSTGFAFGIFNDTDATKIGNIANTGIISGYGTSSGSSTAYGFGINNAATMGSITNTGIISGIGTRGGIGISNSANSKQMGAITNTGVIYGTGNAINRDNGTIDSSSNYGILVNGNGNNDVVQGLDIVDEITKENQILNKGLIFKAVVGGYKAEEKDYKKFGKTFDNGAGITIINAKAIDGEPSNANTEKNIVGTKSLELENGILTYTDNGKEQTETISSSKGYILNGITNTLKVSEGNNELNNSVINAYGTAVVFGDTGDKELTLSGTVVNGGIDNSAAILGSNGEDTLILQSMTSSEVTQNTVVNGNINMGAGADTLTIGDGTIINGILDGGTGDFKDTLNFGVSSGAKSIPAESQGINIMHNISNFENINVGENTNVTLFEKTIGADGKETDLKVTGVEEINIKAGGVLNLRIDSQTIKNGRYEGHALFGNTGLKINGDISQLPGGKTEIKETEIEKYKVGIFNLITNGLGINSIIAMNGITLNENLFVKTNSILDKAVILEEPEGDEGKGEKGDIKIEGKQDIFEIEKSISNEQKYIKLNEIYKGIYSSEVENFNALKDILTLSEAGGDYTSVTDKEQLAILLSYLSNIYTETPYSYSSELSRKSMGMFRDIITENQFKPDMNKWLIMGGLTHRDGGTKDTYYGKNYYGFDTGTADVDVDMKLTGAYALGKYGYSENVSLGVTVGGNRSEAKLPMSKVKGNSGYVGAFAENYRGNLTLKAGAGIQYSEYDADRATLGGHSYSDKYSDMTYDIYLNGRYSHNIGENLFLEPYGTLSYTYVDQEGADEGSKVLAIETDSKTFDYTAAKVGVDLKKVIPHEKGKSTLSAGVSYTRLLTGADEENITGRFKGENATDFDILVAHKNEQSIGLNAKYALELESGILFDVKGSYSVERDSHNGTGKNRNKGEWIVGAGIGYKF
ncbi:autotransporter domain-containing protein [Fusobacterium varium]